MLTTIEVTSRAIRLCREEQGRITALESFEIAPGSDPLQALAAAPLPNPLGRVRVVMQHGDMLLRTMVQPPCPIERLGKIVRFELQSSGEAEAVATTWHLVAGMGSGDMRLITLVTKRKLIDELRAALKLHGGKLEALVHPAIGLYQAYRALGAGEQGASMLVDIGGANLHLVLVVDGELLFMRSQNPGMDELVKQVGELRSLSEPDAAALVAKLGKGAPEDLHEAIKRQAGAVASVLTANIRFAKAQLRLDQLDPKTVWMAGAGAQVYGFAEALAAQMGKPVKPINPFSGTPPALPSERLDRLAALPSPWTVAIGAARAKQLELDAMQEDREQRVLFWRTDGALRVAAALVATLLVLAAVRQEVSIGSSGTLVDMLDGHGADKNGMVPKAEKARAELMQLNDAKVLATSRLNWIDGERRPGRIAVELFSAIAEQEDPANCPVFLSSYKIARQGGQVVADIEGFAQGSGKRASDAVLRLFEQGLVKRYPPITAIKQLPKPIDPTRQQFHYLITISDQPAEVTREAGGDAAKLKLTLALPPGVDAEGAARVAATRERTKGEASVTVKVVPPAPTDPKDKSSQPQDIVVSFKD
jgi:hypothetical protein